MKFANHDGRLALVPADVAIDLDGAPAIDVGNASGGSIPSDPTLAFERWDEVLAWAEDPGEPNLKIDPALLGPPSPRPAQIFGVGLNYADHGAESGMAVPDVPLVFTKLQTAVTGPFGSVELTTETVDWEVEIGVVIGRAARSVTAEDAWGFVAGLTIGQDLSDRDVQLRPPERPQFGLGKSLPGFGPIGPLLVTPDEFPNPDDVELACFLNGEEMQRSRSSEMIFSVTALVEYLSGILPLLPGDVIFTGTPSGVGMARKPPQYLTPGDTLESYVEGVGRMSHTFTAGGRDLTA
jgi:2-keto-4-pentenoate hydratase/2-oxohepta-3-ene-1,7-dioic acid hydratase in catechol pathway